MSAIPSPVFEQVGGLRVDLEGVFVVKSIDIEKLVHDRQVYYERLRVATARTTGNVLARSPNPAALNGMTSGSNVTDNDIPHLIDFD